MSPCIFRLVYFCFELFISVLELFSSPFQLDWFHDVSSNFGNDCYSTNDDIRCQPDANLVISNIQTCRGSWDSSSIEHSPIKYQWDFFSQFMIPTRTGEYPARRYISCGRRVMDWLLGLRATIKISTLYCCISTARSAV